VLELEFNRTELSITDGEATVPLTKCYFMVVNHNDSGYNFLVKTT
jgi:hypothetical protein